MLKLLCTAFVLGISILSFSQTTTVDYLNDYGEVVPEKRAKSTRTIIQEVDGSNIIEIKDYKTGNVIERDGFRGEEPVGKWIIPWLGGVRELDYDFELKYGKGSCRGLNGSTGILNYMIDDPAKGYLAPKVNSEDSTFAKFLFINIRYPKAARQNGLTGTVLVSFKITEEDNIENVVVSEGVHPILDKEAVRVIRKMKITKPAKLNGEVIYPCVTLPVSFKLGN